MPEVCPQDVYARARELVLQGWATKAWARDAKGGSVKAQDPSACALCLSGALGRACSDLNLTRSQADQIFDHIGSKIPGVRPHCVFEWNDTRSQQEVAEFFSAQMLDVEGMVFE